MENQYRQVFKNSSFAFSNIVCLQISSTLSEFIFPIRHAIPIAQTNSNQYRQVKPIINRVYSSTNNTNNTSTNRTNINFEPIRFYQTDISRNIKNDMRSSLYGRF